MVLDHTRAVYTSEDEQGFTFRQIMNQYLAVDDYRDAIVFLYQAYKMRPLAIYQEELCTFRINGAPFPRQRCKRLALAVRYPFVVTC